MQQFSACSSVGRCDHRQFICSQMEFNWFFSWKKTHTSTSPPNFMIIGATNCEINSYLWEVQNLPKKWQLFDWSKVTLIERPSSWKHVYKWLRDLSLVLDWSRSMTSNGYKSIWLWSIFGTQIWYSNLKIKTKLKMKIKFKF